MLVSPVLLPENSQQLFASTGTPSFFVHGTEAVHGDLGMVAKDDVVILISNSGETAEILATLPSLKKMGNYLISFTRSHHSSLAISCDLSVEIPVKSEADNLGLAPSCSSTVVLVVGDAVALALSELKNLLVLISAYIIQEVHSALKQIHNFKI